MSSREYRMSDNFLTSWSGWDKNPPFHRPRDQKKRRALGTRMRVPKSSSLRQSYEELWSREWFLPCCPSVLHARCGSQMIDRFLCWGDHGNPKSGKIKDRCCPPLVRSIHSLVDDLCLRFCVDDLWLCRRYNALYRRSKDVAYMWQLMWIICVKNVLDATYIFFTLFRTNSMYTISRTISKRQHWLHWC